MAQSPKVEARTALRDGMKITWHQGIEASDGLVLRADVFRPIEEGRYPVILTYVFGGKVSLHAGKSRQPYLLLPIIPAK